MGVAGKVGQDGLGTGERTLGIHHPLAPAQRHQPPAERAGIDQGRVLAEEVQLAGAIALLEFLDEAPTEQARQHAHGQEEPAPASDPALPIWRNATAGDDAMHVGMMRQCRTPGVQDQGGADLGAEMFRIGGEGRQRFRCDVEQQPVDHGLVGVGDGTDGFGQREDDVVVLDGQQIGVLGLEPALGGTRLALRAMSIAAGVVADLLMPAGMATQCVSAQRRGTALFDGRHDLELTEAQVA